MLVEKISTNQNPKKLLEKIGVDGGGKAILESKMDKHLFYIKNLHVGAANILKQDALSIGADLAVPKGTIIAQEPYIDAILIASSKELGQLILKEKAQPFGLKELAQELKKHTLKQKSKKIKIMGIINANEDSFFEGSRFLGSSAIDKIEQLLEDGADIIDIGAVSSRPGSKGVSEDEELYRARDIIDAIYEQKLYQKHSFSIDSYSPKVIEYALSHGFSIVNDITGLADDEVCKITASHGASAIIMHMQGTPSNMQNNPHYDNLLSEISEFFTKRIEKAEHFGIKDIVLDVGIGFGKTLEHNLQLIRDLEHFKSLNKELLIGASRKSLIDKIIPTPTDERLPGTLALHLKAAENGAGILRVHDVKEHLQALKVLEAIKM